MSIDLARELEELKRIVEGHGQDLRVFSQLARTQLRGERLSRVGVGPGVRSLDMRMPREPGVGHGSDQAFDMSAADTLGNVLQWAGQANVLLDPTFEAIKGGLTLTTSEQPAGYWAAHYVLNSGTGPSSVIFGLEAFRYLANQNPSNSAKVSLQATFGAAASNIDVYLYPVSTDDFAPASIPVSSWLVAALRIDRGTTDWSAFAVANVRMEILKDGVLVASGDTYDIKNATVYDFRPITAATEQAAATFRGSAWRWRLRLHLEKAAVATPTFKVSMVEPQLHFAYTPDPIPFQPAIANWKQGNIQSLFILGNQGSPSQITGTRHNYTPFTGLPSILRLSTDASRDITGITQGVNGFILLIHNIGSFDIVFKHENASSTAANRFLLPGSADVTIEPGDSVWFRYDGVSERWRMIGVTGAAAGTAKYATNVGDGVSTSIVVTHNLGTEDVDVTVYEVVTKEEVDCEVDHTSANTVTLFGFTLAPLSNSLRCVVIG